MRTSIRALVVAALAAALPVCAHALELVTPSRGVTLRGGSFETLEWRAAELPRGAEEWEAFLSIDGGHYYAFRITPHLDIDRRRFTFSVPNVDTHEARILIRTGNEKQETHFESRGSFSIVRDPNAERIVLRPLQFGRGEAARDGDPAVLSWAAGARNGSGLTQQSSTAVPSPSLGRLTTVTSDGTAALARAGSRVAHLSMTSTRRSALDLHARKAEPLPLSVDLLLVCSRRNV